MILSPTVQFSVLATIRRTTFRRSTTTFRRATARRVGVLEFGVLQLGVLQLGVLQLVISCEHVISLVPAFAPTASIASTESTTVLTESLTPVPAQARSS
jgi:hypothetical protein